jgi:hypothetical protein
MIQSAIAVDEDAATKADASPAVVETPEEASERLCRELMEEEAL